MSAPTQLLAAVAFGAAAVVALRSPGRSWAAAVLFFAAAAALLVWVWGGPRDDD